MVLRLHRTIAERSRQQLGLIRRDQVLDLGISEEQLWGAVRNGSLERLEPNVFRVAGTPPSWHQSLMAGQLGLGAGSLVSHRSAAALWKMDGCRPGPVDFLVERGHRNRLAVGRVHSTLHLIDEDRAEAHGFRLTSATRTIVDIAPMLTRRALETAVDGACRDRLTTESALLECHFRLRRPGRSMLAAVLGAEMGQARPHTWLEREFVRILRRAGVPVPELQTVLNPEGRVVRVDGLYPAHRVITEVAGHRTHSTRRDRQADAERKLRLELDGYDVVEFTYEDVTERPAYVIARTLQVLRAKGSPSPRAA